MSIFDSILSKIFRRDTASAEVAASGPPAEPAPTAPEPLPPGNGEASGAHALAPVDVEAVLTELATTSREHLDWRHSIVDLMKLLGLDSTLAARKQLAAELNYSGTTDDSAAMNIWLHKQVMLKLAENGGVVPEDLKR